MEEIILIGKKHFDEITKGVENYISRPLSIGSELNSVHTYLEIGIDDNGIFVYLKLGEVVFIYIKQLLSISFPDIYPKETIDNIMNILNLSKDIWIKKNWEITKISDDPYINTKYPKNTFKMFGVSTGLTTYVPSRLHILAEDGYYPSRNSKKGWRFQSKEERGTYKITCSPELEDIQDKEFSIIKDDDYLPSRILTRELIYDYPGKLKLTETYRFIKLIKKLLFIQDYDKKLRT